MTTCLLGLAFTYMQGGPIHVLLLTTLHELNPDSPTLGYQIMQLRDEVVYKAGSGVVIHNTSWERSEAHIRSLIPQDCIQDGLE